MRKHLMMMIVLCMCFGVFNLWAGVSQAQELDDLLIELDQVIGRFETALEQAANAKAADPRFLEDLGTVLANLRKTRASLGALPNNQTQNSYIPAGTLAWTEKPVYNAKEKIIVAFSGFPGNKQDWVSLAKVGTKDSSYPIWQYTDGKTSGRLEFDGLAAGDYEVRVYYNWPNGGFTVHSRYKFTVSD